MSSFVDATGPLLDDHRQARPHPDLQRARGPDLRRGDLLREHDEARLGLRLRSDDPLESASAQTEEVIQELDSIRRRNTPEEEPEGSSISDTNLKEVEEALGPDKAELVATAIGVPISKGAVTAEGDLDFRGTLGVDKGAPVGF